MPLVKGGALVDDPYAQILDDAPVAEGTAVLLPADRFMADAAELTSRMARIGVLWPNNRPVADLAPYLNNLTLVALHFPTFRDGRAYSQARILRERHHYRGELRATGDVLRDQFLFMLRAGFDAFAVKKPKDVQAFSRSVDQFSTVYQPATDHRATAFELRRSDAARDPA